MTKDEALKLALEWYDSGAEGREEFEAMIKTILAQRKPLTDEEIEDYWEHITGHSIFGGDRSAGRPMFVSADEVTEFARAIDAHEARSKT